MLRPQQKGLIKERLRKRMHYRRIKAQHEEMLDKKDITTSFQNELRSKIARINKIIKDLK